MPLDTIEVDADQDYLEDDVDAGDTTMMTEDGFLLWKLPDLKMSLTPASCLLQRTPVL